MKVTGFAERRGDADVDARAVRGPDAQARAAASARDRGPGEREAGRGRPTKQERRVPSTGCWGGINAQR